MEGRSVIGCLDKSSFGGVVGEKPDWNGYEREKRRIGCGEYQQLLSYVA